jgi:hypothetical protein
LKERRILFFGKEVLLGVHNYAPGEEKLELRGRRLETPALEILLKEYFSGLEHGGLFYLYESTTIIT